MTAIGPGAELCAVCATRHNSYVSCSAAAEFYATGHYDFAAVPYVDPDEQLSLFDVDPARQSGAWSR